MRICQSERPTAWLSAKRVSPCCTMYFTQLAGGEQVVTDGRMVAEGRSVLVTVKVTVIVKVGVGVGGR